MRDGPYITRTALQYGITTFDVRLVLSGPLEIMLLSEAVELTPDLSERAWKEWGLDTEDRPNVMVYAGYGILNRELVAFLDRFEGWVFHTEPGKPPGTAQSPPKR